MERKQMTKEEAEKAGYHHYDGCSAIPCIFINDDGEYITIEEYKKRLEK